MTKKPQGRPSRPRKPPRTPRQYVKPLAKAIGARAVQNGKRWRVQIPDLERAGIPPAVTSSWGAFGMLAEWAMLHDEIDVSSLDLPPFLPPDDVPYHQRVAISWLCPGEEARR